MEIKEYIDEFGYFIKEYYDEGGIYRKSYFYGSEKLLMGVINFSESGGIINSYFYSLVKENHNPITKEQWEIERNRLVMLNEL